MTECLDAQMTRHSKKTEYLNVKMLCHYIMTKFLNAQMTRHLTQMTQHSIMPT